MQFTTTTTVLVLAAALTTASPLEQRQVEFHAVGNLYSSGGCTSQSLIFADPIFGPVNTCQLLDRNGNVPPIISYKTLSVDSGCKVTLFYDSSCSQPAGGFAAGLNGCVTGNSPFERAIVTCA